ncbi:MAG: phosphoribosylformylglycinamidine cyclo-ligase [Candidatus Binatia bacterium]|nr:MAG: phosphoribosylformylglycinamidine cyclo-ligase [Candidatus Binatia bacterium]
MSLTYRDAGVDIDKGEQVARAAARLARATRRPEVCSGIGGFGALFRIPRGYRRPILVTATDGVGTKLAIASMLGRHDTVGIDLVAMNVNDILTLGAEPIAFLDYFVTERLEPSVAEQVLRGIARGCRMAGCALVGGETAEHPGCMRPGEYDLAGFVVGVVEETRVVDGRHIRAGDVLIGLASSGLHSNGFSLVRQIVLERAKLALDAVVPEFRRPLGEELLEPTRIYVPAVRALPVRDLHGMAHITGGGIVENVPRMFPKGLAARIVRGSWPVPPVFPWLQRLGDVPEDEMLRTFNMGLGFVLVVRAAAADRIVSALRARRMRCWVIGEVVVRRRAQPQVVFVS